MVDVLQYKSTAVIQSWDLYWLCPANERLILGLRPANEKHRYKVKLSLIGWVQP